MENRKIKLSKQLLKQAFLELLEEKNIHQISVRELCAKADLNRSTFYVHYEDINYLIRDIEDDILNTIPFMDYTKKRSQKDIIEFASFIERNKNAIMALVKNGRLIDRLIESSVAHVLKEGHKTDKEIEYFKFISYYCVGGMFQALLFYMNQGSYLTVKEISNILYPLFIESEKIRITYEEKV